MLMFIPSCGPKYFECKLVGFMGVVLAVEVTEFIMKDTCSCNVI